MEESVTYQAIIAKDWNSGMAAGMAEGKAEEARSLLLRIGGKRFGPPDTATRSAIEVIRSVEQLEVLVERVVDVLDWKDLFTGLS